MEYTTLDDLISAMQSDKLPSSHKTQSEPSQNTSTGSTLTVKNENLANTATNGSGASEKSTAQHNGREHKENNKTGDRDRGKDRSRDQVCICLSFFVLLLFK